MSGCQISTTPQHILVINSGRFFGITRYRVYFTTAIPLLQLYEEQVANACGPIARHRPHAQGRAYATPLNTLLVSTHTLLNRRPKFPANYAHTLLLKGDR